MLQRWERRRRLHDSERSLGLQESEVVLVANDRSVLLLERKLSAHFVLVADDLAEMRVAGRSDADARRASAGDAHFERDGACVHLRVAPTLAA